MAAYIGLRPHMDVITHHTTIAGDFAMTRSQWFIKGVDAGGKPVEVHHRGMEVHCRCRRHLGVLHRSSLRRRRDLGGRGTAGD
jgi:hypothetical protein